LNYSNKIQTYLIYRTGWVLRDIKEPESIADHMYRMAVMSFLAPKNVDKNKYIFSIHTKINSSF
jgi:5'-deoxynucleotidase YfbR-like HD superfamily hydrolase